MINETKVRQLQNIYLFTRSEETLSALYKEIYRISYSITKYKLKNIPAERTIIAHDCATRFLEQYMKHPTWECLMFAKRIGFEVQYQLYNKKKRRDEKIEILCENNVRQEQDKEDISTALEDLEMYKSNSDKILFDIYRSRSFKEAIRRIYVYESKEFITCYIKRLKKIYICTRRNK